MMVNVKKKVPKKQLEHRHPGGKTTLVDHRAQAFELDVSACSKRLKNIPQTSDPSALSMRQVALSQLINTCDMYKNKINCVHFCERIVAMAQVLIDVLNLDSSALPTPIQQWYVEVADYVLYEYFMEISQKERLEALEALEHSSNTPTKDTHSKTLHFTMGDQSFDIKSDEPLTMSWLTVLLGKFSCSYLRILFKDSLFKNSQTSLALVSLLKDLVGFTGQCFTDASRVRYALRGINMIVKIANKLVEFGYHSEVRPYYALNMPGALTGHT
jgi:hypothetical protein